MANPKGNLRSDSTTLREKHYRFIGASYAIGYKASEVVRMLNQEFGIELTYQSVRYYFTLLDQLGLQVYSLIQNEAITGESIQRILSNIAPTRKKLVSLFEEYCINHRKVREDPAYGIPYADKRRRVMKLSQNIDEMDSPEVVAKGSYPTSQKDGNMTFETFAIERKNFQEQRRTIESIGGLVDGLSAGDVIINIVGQAEETNDSQPSE